LFVAPLERSHPVTATMMQAWKNRHTMLALIVIGQSAAIEFIRET
jgi:hypothetical protein